MKVARWALALALAVGAVVADAGWVAHDPAPQVSVAAATPIVQPTTPATTTPATTTPATTTPAATTPAPAPSLVPWHGPVEHLFFHPLVIDPAKAFRSDTLGQGFKDYFVTATEFRKIVDSLWRKGFTLVDAHLALNGRVRVPPGRKPLVLSEDDANYYHYFDGRGLAQRLVLNSAGDVEAELPDGSLTDDDLVPIVDVMVRQHPEFSAGGAKGILAVTGYEGLLGEHDVATDLAARTRVRALADALRAEGWSFASHTYGHIDLSKDSVRRIAADTARWRALVGDLLGPIDMLVYPFGARPPAEGVRFLVRAGFPYQFDIDVRPFLGRRDGAVVMSRRHVDGLAFAVPARLAPFFAVAAVVDPGR